MVKVIVIGAGMAGLSAARKLVSEGKGKIEVLVVEGRNRLGGRLHTIEVKGENEGDEVARVDIGGAWIHGIRDNPITALAKKFSVDLIPTRWDTFTHVQISRQNNNNNNNNKAAASQEEGEGEEGEFTLLSQAEMEHVCDLFEASYDLIEKRQNKGKIKNAESVEEVLHSVMETMGLSEDDKALTRYGWCFNEECDWSVNLRELSGRHWNSDEEFDGDHCMLRQGYGQVIEGLARDLNVRLNLKVQRIEQTERGVQITMEDLTDGNIVQEECDFCISTIPVGVMRKHLDSLFSPPLPADKIAALNKVGISIMNKVVMRFPTAWWDKAIEEKRRRTPGQETAKSYPIHYFGNMDRQKRLFVNPPPLHPISLPSSSDSLPVGVESVEEDDVFIFPSFHNHATQTGAPILVGYFSANSARLARQWTDEETVEKALHTLGLMFGKSNVQKPIFTHVTRWHADEFSLGAYSSLPPTTSPEDFGKIGQSVWEGRLRFAGEATEKYYSSTVHGAHMSGVREAKAILKVVAKN